MIKSPLQFARDFARLQGQLAALPPGDSQLLLALDFWQEMREYRGDAAYRSYFDEYLPLLMQLVEPANLADLSIAELVKARSILSEIKDSPALVASQGIGSKLDLVIVTLAKVYFYVGAVEEGLAELADSRAGGSVGQAFLRPDREGLVGQNPSGPDREWISQAPRGLDLHGVLESTNEFVALQTICARATESNHPLGATLNGILTDWQAEREAVYHDRARCLFVERDDTGSRVRGRMRTLVGRIELFGKSARTDEITFDNAIKTPDDPFVGVAYSALAAVRKMFGGFSVGQEPVDFDMGGVGKGSSPSSSMSSPRRRGTRPDPTETLDSRFRGNDNRGSGNDKGGDASVGREPRAPDSGVARGAGAPPARVGLDARMSKPPGSRPTVRSSQASHFYHAHYTIENSGQTFTGDSIGLAFGLLAYVQLLRPEVLRLDRLLSGEVAFTGGVDTDGRLTAVNDETLGQKIERAFFSPVKYVALPEANAATAKQHLYRLRKLYPHRNLHLIAAERLTDIIEDHNIVRSEKVCIGEFVAKKAAKYGRMTKVQVPLLLVLAYLLLCLIYPKAWVLFKWNPDSIKFIENGFVVYNADAHELWRNVLPSGSTIDGTTYWRIDDLNGDGWKDVMLMPLFTSANKYSGWIFAYSHRGDSLFARDCAIRGEYPLYGGEIDRDTNIYDVSVETFRAGDKLIIITQTYSDYPDRSMIRFLDVQSNFLGWYVNAGGTGLKAAGDVDRDGKADPIFFGFNQLLGCIAIFALSPDSSRGVSPPFDAPELDLSHVKKGNQLAYVMFPPTDVGKISLRAEYNHLQYLSKLAEGEYRATINEADMLPGGASVDYYLNARLRVTGVRLSDSFIKQRNELIKKGLVKDIPKLAYEEMLRDNVTYWTGSEYVTEGQLRSQGQ